MSTTSRMMLYAPTGLGKTNFAMAMAIHLAAGKDFLRWRVPGARRVMYIDGEMPDVLAQERIWDAVRRLGVRPEENFFYFNRRDFPDMEPLNTEAGRRRVDEWLGVVGNIDLVVFDNIQSLTAGNMRETEIWSAVRPWTQILSDRRIGQIWIHHTGSNETKAYGDSTMQWQLDTVLRLERVEAATSDIAFNLDFTGKSRNRTPKNRHDYEPGLVTLAGDTWTIGPRVNKDSSIEKATQFLRMILTTNGPMTVAELKKAAEANGHAWGTIIRAKDQLGLASGKGVGKGAPWSWNLPPLVDITES
jgi:hypothetical protein